MKKIPQTVIVRTITLDRIGNTLATSEPMRTASAQIYPDRPHTIGRHAGMCNETIGVVHATATHTVIACEGRCRLSMNIPRSVTTVGALRDWCAQQIELADDLAVRAEGGVSG